MWKRFSQIDFVHLIVGLFICVCFLLTVGKTMKEWQSWDEIARNQIETEATVLSKMGAFSDSGITKYDISYEFVAPAAVGGSNYSQAALGERTNEILKEKFWGRSEKNISDIKMPEQRKDGNQYFSKTQVVEPGTVNQHLSGNTIQIVYAKDNPQNSLIKGTGGYPLFWIIFLSGLLILNGYVVYLSVRPAFRPKF